MGLIIVSAIVGLFALGALTEILGYWFSVPKPKAKNRANCAILEV